MAPLDLTTCDSEPIHVPGAIQPHGILAVVDPSTHLVTHVSANVEQLLGRAPATLLGQNIDLLVGNGEHSLKHELFGSLIEGRPVYQSTLMFAGSELTWDVIVHRHLDQIFLEFEPARIPEALRVNDLYHNLQDALVRLEHADTVIEMAELATTRVRSLTGFDRVMLYRFDRDWNGEVIAEDRRDDLETFLGLNYPASDIPQQARLLYTKNWLRFITDRDYTPVPVLTISPGNDSPLDMSFAVLRSVSPIHLEYLRNMGVYASMSISILRQGQLWGLIACHHYSPKYVPYDLRKACELLGHFMSLQIAQAEANEAAVERQRLSDYSKVLVANLEREEDLANAVIRAKPNILDFIEAGGAAVVTETAITRIGDTPNESEIRELSAWLAERKDEVFATDELRTEFGTGVWASIAAGVMAINLGHQRLNQIIWFRPERIRTVNWAGDPRKVSDGQTPDRLSPRGSFALWRETVKGKSEPWTDDQIAAAHELRQNIVRLMLKRAEILALAHDDLRLASVEREKVLEAERVARSESERLNRVKDEFVATLSHELRTPLNAILGWAQLLKMSDQITPDEFAEGLDVIERNAKSQATMIEDLMEISRIVSGRLRLDLQDVDIAEIVEGAIESLSVAAAGKKVRLETLIDPLVGINATGDPNRLRQIVWNLLSNAIKFTPAGGKVQVVLEKVDSHVELTISDTGIGIKPEFLPHIFERYRQADATITRQYGGLGLGLAIVRNLVELHGGHISADSAGENQGATFTVSLPIRVVAKTPERQVTATKSVDSHAESRFDLTGLRVLVVDDEDDARHLIRRVLSAARCDVTCCDSSAAALAETSQKTFDLIVSDIGMPLEDGYAFIRNQRQHELSRQLKRTPAIALTAYARKDDRRRALIAGFNAHLTKPVDANELLTIIASLTDRIPAS